MEVVMNNPQVRLRTRLAVLATAGGLLAGLFPMAGPVLAAVSITPASTSISADTAVGAPRGTTAWTSLSGPVVTEGAAGDISTGALTLTLSGSYEFRTSPVPGAAFSAAAGTCGLTTTTPIVTATTISTTIGGSPTTGGSRCQLTFSGIQVRPTTGVMPNVGSLAFSGAFSGAAGTLTMVVGAPILTFTQQPSASATGGAVLAVQPRVESSDQFDNPRPGDVITLAIHSGPVGGILTCTPATNQATTVPPVAGDAIASFAGCSLDRVGSYTLRATTTGQVGTIPVTTPPTVVTVGPAARLVFVQRPTAAVANVAFPMQPIVAVADAGGNILPSGPPTSITLGIGVNPAAGTLTCPPAGTTVTTAATGIGMAATFAGCRINNAGIGYTLTAAASGLTGATTPAFDVQNTIVFTQQPAGAVGGAAFTTQPIVALRAGALTSVNDSTTVVTLSIRPGTGAAGAILTCTGGLSRTVVAGVATFAGCSIDRLSPAGNPYQLVASTITGLTAVNSATFPVTVGPAARLAFTVQPVHATMGQPFPVAPAVSIQDAGGNVITTGADSTRSVTLAIGVNPAAGILTCPGGLTRSAVAGVATFTGCSIDRPGTGYTLVATSTGLTSATSTAFNVTVLPGTITLVRTTGMIRFGDSVGFSIQFGPGGANRTFVLEHTFVGQPWTTIATLTTNAAGFASTTFAATRTGFYRARFAGAPDLAAATSNVLLVGVRQTVTLSPGHTGVVTIARGRSITFRATVRPLRPDALPSAVRFQFFQRVGATWVLRSARTVATDPAGVASTTFRFGVRGTWHVRAFAPRTPFNSISRPTPRVFYRVL
jgi:hypothetical protein